MLLRPRPPESLFDHSVFDWFTPAPDLVEWMAATFIEDGAALQNEDHAHLRQARLGALWTNCGNTRHGRTILATCETGDPKAMGKWARARADQQMIEWFGEVPDFILTFDAGYADTCSDVAFCALVEHELYHAGQEQDGFGQPKFTREGKPKFGLRGHDIEEFVGVVRRYGIVSEDVKRLVDAAQAAPEIDGLRVSHACGACQPLKAA